MRISVIVPVYNVEQYLDECVQSIVTTMSDRALGDRFAARYRRFRALCGDYPEIAALSINTMATAGLRYYNRGLPDSRP